jgi:hypothetical protein
VTLASGLIGGKTSTATKTAGAIDKVDDAAKLAGKVENVADDVVVNPRNNNTRAIDDTNLTNSVAGTIDNELGNAPNQSSFPPWLKQQLDEGRDFNAAQNDRFPYNELYIEDPKGGSHFKLDSYNDISGEIVSRKLTQLADIQEQTAKNYISEIEKKYAPGRTIANVPTSGSLAGETLRGTKFLEVPVQTRPIPQAIIDAADRADVTIRDVNGRIHNP